MSEPNPGMVLDDSAPLLAAAEPFGAPERGQLKAGDRWHDFVIEAPWRAGGLHAYTADRVGLLEKVVIRARAIGEATEWRRGAWDQLCRMRDAKIIRCIEAHEEAGWRYEVTTVPPETTLREWLACHRAGAKDVETLVRQLAAILGALHAQGVVHLNIRPESIHLDETAGEPVFLLGGLHEATLYTQPKLTSVEVDALYAPPEAMELESCRPGTRLCAWDWWSVGRVVQELLLGRHVLGVVLDCDVSRMTRELRAAAESLLRESAPAGVRAGAVDYTSADAATTGLLRGLLTNSCAARWGLDSVERWLEHETVSDGYDLPPAARIWFWRGRSFSLAEATEFFTQASNWADGEDTLFNLQDPDSLAYFLNETPAHRADWERLHAVCQLTETRAWEEVPAVVRRTVTAALAWLSLATGNGTHAAFRVRGRTCDVTGLTELLTLADGEGVALVSALHSPALIEFVESLDAPAARGLKTLAMQGGAAAQLALQEGWLDPHDRDGHAKILALALERAALLRERVALLHAAYATNRHPALARLLAQRDPSPMERVLLVFTGDAPEQNGYVTHADWRRERQADLEAQARRIVTVLFWLRLRRLLTVGRLWGLPWPIFGTITLGFSAAAGWLGREVEPAAAAATALLLSRGWLWVRARSSIRRCDPAAAPWEWSDGLKRCDEEMRRVLSASNLTPTEIAAERRRLCTALAEFVPAAAARRAVAVPGVWEMGAVVMAGATLATVVLAQAAMVYHSVSRTSPPSALFAAPNSAVKPSVAGSLPAAAPESPAADVVNDPDRLLATGRYEVLDDGFGRRLRGPLKKWNFTSPPTVAALVVEGRAPASPDQAAFALVSGNLLAQPYMRKSINVLLAVPVPTSRGTGLLIFNTRDRQLVDREVQLVRTPLTVRTWYQLGARRVVFLGAPPGLDPEISLAPP